MEKQESSLNGKSTDFEEITKSVDFSDLTAPKEEKKKYKRRSKAEIEESQKSPIDIEALRLIVNIYFNRKAEEKGKEHWKLTEKESTSLCEALDKVALKYAPDMFSKYGAEMALAAVGASIFIPRLMIDSKIKKAEENREKKIE